MGNETTLRTFPDTPEKAIAMLCVQSQDLSGKSPAEVYTLYWETYYQILRDRRQKLNSDWFQTQQEAVLQDSPSDV